MSFFSKDKEDKTKADSKDSQKARPLSKDERIEQGQLYCRVIIEMIGKPKEHLEKTFDEFIQQFIAEPDVSLIKKNLSKTKKHEALFSRYAELEFWAKDLSLLIGLCFDYMPTSVEILEPAEVTFPINRLSNYINELQAKLHHVDMIAKNAQTEKAIISSNFFKLMENTILIAAASGGKTKKDLAAVTGLDEASMDRAIKSLTEEKKLLMSGDKYVLA